MNRFANRCCVAVLLLAAVCLSPTNLSAAQTGRTTVVVHVYNNAKVPSSILAETGGYVRETLDRIGVEMIWVDEMSHLHGPDAAPLENSWTEVSAAHVSLAIVTGGERVDPRLKNDETAMGRTPAGQSVRCYVFYDRVEAFVLKNAFRVTSLRIPGVLAHAVEHELGHLLIPPLATAHPDTGIMKAQLSAGDLAPEFLDAVGFSAKEGELMRREIQRRVNTAAQASTR